MYFAKFGLQHESINSTRENGGENICGLGAKKVLGKEHPEEGKNDRKKSDDWCADCG